MKMKFEHADPWVLLAIIYASGPESSEYAKLSDIIACGDAINHAIFTTDELKGGLYRLLREGYIKEDNLTYAPTEKALEVYNKNTSSRRYIFKDLDLLMKHLKSPDWTKEYKPNESVINVSYDKINETIVNQAYKEYKKNFRNN